MLQVFLEPFWMIFKLYFENVLEMKLLEYVANIVEKPQGVSEDAPFGHHAALNKSDDGSSEEGETHHEGGKKMTNAEKREMLK